MYVPYAVRTLALRTGGGQLDKICDEEVRRDEHVKEKAGYDIGPLVVVAANADQDAILLQLASRKDCQGSVHTFCRFTIIKRKLDTTAAC